MFNKTNSFKEIFYLWKEIVIEISSNYCLATDGCRNEYRNVNAEYGSANTLYANLCEFTSGSIYLFIK